ncbi:MAG: SGNH/GDSL hydrolase family protein [Bacteroidia bacterium]|nr:SGNH/GDSL hydrolase family protein [Bacteroidia bacterium]
MRSRILFVSVLLMLCLAGFSQGALKMKWWNPVASGFRVIEGQGWPGEFASPYDRLPSRAEKSVRPAVWNLSGNSAGLMIRFRSNAGRIVVRYQVAGAMNMPHMPSTGVSGIDLYAKNADGAWLWSNGRYSFGDTVVYQFNGLEPNDSYHQMGREYRLYLPLYNTVKWMEIGVADTSLFSPLPVRREKPVVTYGTSIMHGACASRPGMAWANILGRKLDRPLINLGFSGNGRLEPEVLSLITEVDAKLYVLDCLPNLVNPKDFPREEVQRRIVAAVRQIRKVRPDAPVLLVDHSGYSDGSLNPVRRQDYLETNEANHQAFALLKTEGVKNIYLLTKEEIGLTPDAMVDGTHPSDLGMQQYANAYEKIIRIILNQPVGSSSPAQPCTQYREPGTYDWEARHETLLALNAGKTPRTVFIGNSITHYWGGEPAHPLHRGEDSWKKVLDPLGTRNFGFGWDRVENVLWRVYHDELDGYQAERVIIDIGTNNLHLNTDPEILEGMELLVNAIRVRQPKADIVVLGLYPRRDYEPRVKALNLKYAQLTGKYNVRFADPGVALLMPDGKIDETLFTDGLHPNAEGYRMIAGELAKMTSGSR